MHMVMMRPQQVRQHLEAVLLGVVEALKKRRAGVGDMLQGGAGLGQVVGPLRQPLERRGRRLALLLLGRFPGLPPLHPQLRHVAQGLLEGRPVFA